MARNLGSLPQRNNEGGPTYRPPLEIKSLPFDNDDKFVAQYWGSRGDEEDILELNGNPGSFCAMDMVDKELWIN